jgi:pyridoxal phosphate enzyme (YggS family)
MVKENILRLKERLASVCQRVNLDPNCITTVAVSKERSIAQIKEAIKSGITDIGENRIQEAVIKYNQLPSLTWHMVGHLQTNKVKDAVRIFDLIHSLDSLRLAEEINRQAGRLKKIQDVLVQINTSGEQSKFGLPFEETVGAIKEISKLNNINVIGLMTIAPLVNNPEKIRPYFRLLRELKDKVNTLSLVSCPLRLLSMGMTDDFEVAIEEGSNMIRIGRAIFEG